MIQIGRLLFYDTQNGYVFFEISEQTHNSDVKIKTIEDEINTWKPLSERNRETFDVIELPYGAYAQDFAESNGYRVNVDTKELEFSYPDPNAPEEPQPYIAPLSEVVAQQTDYLLDVDFRLMMVELGIQ